MAASHWVYAGVGAVLILGVGLAQTLSSPPPPGPAALKPQTSPPLPDTNAVGEMIAWSASTDGDPKQYRIANISIAASSKKLGGDPPIPRLRVELGKDVLEAEGGPGFDTAQASFGVGKLDPRSDQNQILFTSYSGGAHCCTDVKVLDHTAKGWISIDAGSWDGGVLETFPKDLNADGSADLVFGDDRFAYTFDSYAGSPKPPRIFNYHAGKITEVSEERSFKPFLETLLLDVKLGCEAHGNGACAALVALSARTGRFDEGWSEMLASYDPASDWVLPTGCSAPRAGQACLPENEIVFRSYPGALVWFLRDAGYLTFSSPAFTAPSFDCRKVQAENLLLICASKDLAMADKALELVYQKALALSGDAEAVRSDQRRWLEARDAAPAEMASIYALYVQRINALRAVGS